MSVNLLSVKGTVIWLKSKFTGQKVSKFDLGLLNTYKLMYFDKNINEHKDGKNFEGNK
jgi:hypothetical protein